MLFKRNCPELFKQEMEKTAYLSVVTNGYRCLGKLFHLELHQSNNVKAKSNQVSQVFLKRPDYSNLPQA